MGLYSYNNRDITPPYNGESNGKENGQLNGNWDYRGVYGIYRVYIRAIG